MKLRALVLSSIIGALTVLSGCASLSAEPVSAQAMDADTGQPLPDVVVMAYWDLHAGSLTGHALPCGAANVEGAVTNNDGEFRIPAWGSQTSLCDMPDWNPWLVFYKFGYYSTSLNNDPLDPLKTVSVSRSVWNGKIIKLHKYPNMNLRKLTPPSYGGSSTS